MAKDPYKLLGVAKSATEAEIKKAYRGLAKKMHPDANPGDEKAAERFKEITAAYTLLSDKNLRAQYDSGKVDASGQQQNPFAGGGFGGGNPFGGGFQQTGMGGDDMSDLFASLFGMQMGAGPGARTRSRMQRPKKGADVRYKLTLSFMEAWKGGAKRINLGGGTSLDVKIPKGVEDGTTLRLRGKGRPGTHGGPSGDAKVDVTVKSDKNYIRDGQNIRLTLPISVQEAVLGAKVRVPLPVGALSLNIPAGTNTGKTFRLKGKGFSGGDLLVSAQIVLENPDDPALRAWAEETGVSEDSEIRETLTKSS